MAAPPPARIARAHDMRGGEPAAAACARSCAGQARRRRSRRARPGRRRTAPRLDPQAAPSGAAAGQWAGRGYAGAGLQGLRSQICNCAPFPVRERRAERGPGASPGKSFRYTKTQLALPHPGLRAARPAPPLNRRRGASRTGLQRKPKSAPSQLRRSGSWSPLTRARCFKGEAFPLALPRIFEAQGCPEGSGFIAGAFAAFGGRAFKQSPRPRGSRRKGDHPCPRRILHARSRRPSTGFSGATGTGSGRRWSVRIAVIRRRSSPSASRRRRRSSIVASNC